MPSVFDTQLSPRMFRQVLARYGEPVIFRTGTGHQREITALVKRLESVQPVLSNTGIIKDNHVNVTCLQDEDDADYGGVASFDAEKDLFELEDGRVFVVMEVVNSYGTVAHKVKCQLIKRQQLFSGQRKVAHGA